MTAKRNRSPSEPTVDPNLKVQDAAIVEAFSLVDHQVVTTAEIHEHVDLSQKQVRRRLNDLADRGIVGTRKPGRDRLWWLEADVTEPITVQYPLLRYVRDRLSVQLFVLGIGVGVLAMVVTMLGTLMVITDPAPEYMRHTTAFRLQMELLRGGLLATVVSSGLLLTGISLAVARWLYRAFSAVSPRETGR